MENPVRYDGCILGEFSQGRKRGPAWRVESVLESLTEDSVWVDEGRRPRVPGRENECDLDVCGVCKWSR